MVLVCIVWSFAMILSINAPCCVIPANLSFTIDHPIIDQWDNYSLHVLCLIPQTLVGSSLIGRLKIWPVPFRLKIWSLTWCTIIFPKTHTIKQVYTVMLRKIIPIIIASLFEIDLLSRWALHVFQHIYTYISTLILRWSKCINFNFSYKSII